MNVGGRNGSLTGRYVPEETAVAVELGHESRLERITVALNGEPSANEELGKGRSGRQATAALVRALIDGYKNVEGTVIHRVPSWSE